jgi:hypothetical protein
VQAHADGPRPLAAAKCDLRGRQAADVVEQDSLPLGRRQPGERVVDRGQPLAGLHSVVTHEATIDALERNQPFARPAKAHLGEVRRYGAEPSSEALAIAELGQAQIRLEDGLLHDVFGLGPRIEEAHHESVRLPQMPLDEGAKLLPVPSEDGGDELAVGLRTVHLLLRCRTGGKGYAPTTLSLPGIRYGTGASLVEPVRIVGAGRVGSALSARLRERGVGLRDSGAGLVLICVPDGAIGEVARSIEPGPWIGHVSGATLLSALDPHRRRFSLHPLQTFTRARGPEQLDGAYAAVTAETEEARAVAVELAEILGLLPFRLADEERALYHAGAAIASNFLVTLRRVAGQLVEDAGAPPEALDPLMRRTIENGFELTGPIARGDWATVDAHVRAIRARRPEYEPVYQALAEVTS